MKQKLKIIYRRNSKNILCHFFHLTYNILFQKILHLLLLLYLSIKLLIVNLQFLPSLFILRQFFKDFSDKSEEILFNLFMKVRINLQVSYSSESQLRLSILI